MTILIADDDQDDIDIFMEAINTISPAISCISVRDGRKVLSVLENTLPDFLFLDINMPVMDGKECVEKIKSMGVFKELPVIIMYTTSINPKEINYYQNLGIRVLTKEVTLAGVVNSLKKILL